jgi:hypothetical protein
MNESQCPDSQGLAGMLFGLWDACIRTTRALLNFVGYTAMQLRQQAQNLFALPA